MSAAPIEIQTILQPDTLASDIANKWVTWHTGRQETLNRWAEVRKYLFATDTTTTSNASLPWKNSTTIPKLTQIRDNLYANYFASLFPKRKWLRWEASDASSNTADKQSAITSYMSWVISQERYKTEMGRLVLDYIDTGNAFGTVEWIDNRPAEKSLIDGSRAHQAGYVGPAVRRISPFDIVFNPTATSFEDTPKIVRSMVSIGEVKNIVDSQTDQNQKALAEEVYRHLIKTRTVIQGGTSVTFQEKDTFYQVDGFTSFRHYLESGTVELLTFYGDIFDWSSGEVYQNYKIVIVDRSKILIKEPNPGFFSKPPIFHLGWRTRQDNLWAMGPLENLVGMQYRIDHVENLKADAFDLLILPPLKVKGFVEDFRWGPLERIHTGDDGDVEMMQVPFQVLQANIEIQGLMSHMEEMAGSPKEAAGFRTPGEKTAYEVQRLENAASRIFNNKIVQFEERISEPTLNACLSLARENAAGTMSIPVFDDDYKAQVFLSLTPNDLVGVGTIKPIAARHFAEQAELIQNLTAFFGSAVGQDEQVRVHFSSVNTAKLIEDALNLQDYNLVTPNIRVTEMADTQRLQQSAQEQVAVEAQTPSGLTPDDTSQPLESRLSPGAMQVLNG